VREQLLSVVAPKIGAREVSGVLEKLAARARRTRRMVIVVLDNAQVHKAARTRATWKRLERWVRPYWLPAYSPDLNDIERIWKREKERTFANELAPSFEVLVARVRRRFRTLAHRACRTFPRRDGRRVRLPAIFKNLGRVA